MARDDYHVIACRILAYLYDCLKHGKAVDAGYLQAGTAAFPVGQAYFDYVLRHLYESGYIDGVALYQPLGTDQPFVSLSACVEITPEGIDYLQSNSAIKRAAEFLKTIKECVPGI